MFQAEISMDGSRLDNTGIFSFSVPKRYMVGRILDNSLLFLLDILCEVTLNLVRTRGPPQVLYQLETFCLCY